VLGAGALSVRKNSIPGVRARAMAACGVYFTVAVTEDGELLACGDGRDGHLGLGAVLHQQEPARAGGPELFANQRIRLAAAGWCHLAVVAEDGAVYTCGAGLNGRLGLGDVQPRRQLTRVPQAVFAGSHVVMVACGGGHTVAVTAAGHAWACGYNDYGQLGVGDTGAADGGAEDKRGDMRPGRLESPQEEDHLRCLDDHHVFSQGRGKRGLLLPYQVKPVEVLRSCSADSP
jgi:alpha-tubulin suppressor-like RCC1 family protein